MSYGEYMMFFFLCSLLLPLLVVCWSFAANHITCNKRGQLISRCKTSGDYKLACDEYSEVSYEQHYWKCFWLKNPKKLYGPLIQGVWKTDHPICPPYDQLWWRCYKEIYLRLPAFRRQRINCVNAEKCHLPYTLISLNYELNDWLHSDDLPQKFAMTGGAEEYEDIMAAQELML